MGPVAYPFRVLSAVVTVVCLAGCAAVQLQLISNPVGAQFVERETGRTFNSPATIPYVLSNKGRDANGCLVVKGFRAVWASGAHTESPDNIQLCGIGPIWHYNFQRPDFAPNLAADLSVQNQIIANQRAGAELLGAFLTGLAQGYAERGSKPVYVPPPISTPGPIPVQQTGSTLPQIAPDGTYVSGSKPVSICPNGKYVSGNCTIAPDGSYVGQ